MLQFLKKKALYLFELLPLSVVVKASDEFLILRYKTQEVVRRKISRTNPDVVPLKSSSDGEVLRKSVLERNAPWERCLPVKDDSIPGMLTESEKKYYRYISKFYSAGGCIVELGPWLGLSTYHIISGLRENPRFQGKIYVYDDFVWRSSWMDKWLEGTNLVKPQNHASFKDLFVQQMFTAGISDLLIVKEQKISPYDGNDHLPTIEWDLEEPIELIIVDCGRTLLVNEGWWATFSPSFIKDKTLIVMQDWQLHKQVPELFYNQIKTFTDSKNGEIELVHEVPNAGIATFLYKGK
jgi:hypothetical protein